MTKFVPNKRCFLNSKFTLNKLCQIPKFTYIDNLPPSSFEMSVL